MSGFSKWPICQIYQFTRTYFFELLTKVTVIRTGWSGFNNRDKTALAMLSEQNLLVFKLHLLRAVCISCFQQLQVLFLHFMCERTGWAPFICLRKFIKVILFFGSSGIFYAVPSWMPWVECELSFAFSADANQTLYNDVDALGLHHQSLHAKCVSAIRVFEKFMENVHHINKNIYRF